MALQQQYGTMSKNPLQAPPPSLGAFFKSLLADEEGHAAGIVELARSGNRQAIYWLDRLVGHAPNEAVLRELAAAAGEVTINARPVVSGKTIDWRYGFSADHQADAANLYALAMIRIIRAGLLGRIRRCALKDCRKLFFGDVRARWCSPTCGSKYRVRAKRKRDRR